MESEYDIEYETEETEETLEISEVEEIGETEENETVDTQESGDNLTFDYERLESAMLADEFTLDSDLNDLYLTDVLLLFIVFILAIVFASKEG